MNKPADCLILHRVYEVGFCEYSTDTTVFIDGESKQFQRYYSNVKPDEAVNYSLAVAVTYVRETIGADAVPVIQSNGSPYVDWQTFNATPYEEDQEVIAHGNE